MKDYAPGLLNDYGGGNVGWWQDYIRAEINRCNAHWREQIDDDLTPELEDKIIELAKENDVFEARVKELEAEKALLDKVLEVAVEELRNRDSLRRSVELWTDLCTNEAKRRMKK